MSASFPSVVALWRHRVTSTPDAAALHGRGPDGSWYGTTWAECDARVRALAAGLCALGIERGERCAIVCHTRVEWMLADLAILCAGAATTTVYPESTDSECHFILQHADCKVCFAEDAAQARRVLGVVPTVVQLTGRPVQGVLSLDELETRGRAWDEANPGVLQEIGDSLGPEDLATLIYTSGTTGIPKGVELTHANWVFEGDAVDKMGLISPQDRHLICLPLAHSFAKVLGLASIRGGVPTYLDGVIGDLALALQAVRPTVMAVVPRILERSRVRILEAASRGPRKRLFRWALGVGEHASSVVRRGKPVRGLLSLRFAAADRLVLQEVRNLFGGQLRALISGGAPLEAEVAEFFHSCGLLVLEGYGLTESSAASTVNRIDAFQFGTVGQPLPGVQIRIADDGEILLGGGGLMRGYHQDPEGTAEVMTEDGWLMTGDIGRLTESGHLIITDRKKDIIVTAGGKNIAPQKVENLLKARIPELEHVLLHGDRRPWCVAICTLSEGATLSVDELRPRVLEVNGELPRFEHVRDIVLVPMFTVADGTLTPTLKVKRPVVEERYATQLDALYIDDETLEAL